MAGKISQAKAPDHTHQEVRYLQRLIDDQTPVRVRLSDNQEVEGIVEFYDLSFIRLTRPGAPNLFLFKQDIKYLYELNPDELNPDELNPDELNPDELD